MMIEALVVHHAIYTNDPLFLQDIDTRYFRPPWDGIVKSVSGLSILTIQTARDVIPPEHHPLFEDSMNRAEDFRAKQNGTFRPEVHVAALRMIFARNFAARLLAGANQAIEHGGDALGIARELVPKLSKLTVVGKEKKNTLELLDDISHERNAYLTIGLPYMRAQGLERIWMGNMGTLGGPSGSFKTTIALEFMRDIIENNQDVLGVMFQAEQPKREMLYKLLAALTDYGYSEIQLRYNIRYPEFTREVRNAVVEKHGDFLDRIRVYDSTDFRTAGDIANTVVQHSKKYKHVFFVVDYLTRLKIDKAGGTNAGVAESLDTLKDVCVTTDSYCLVVSQLLKGWNHDHARRPIVRVPNREDLIWTSELANLSANILTLLRPATVDPEAKASEDGRALILMSLEKIRHQDINIMIPLKLNGESQTLYQPDPLDMKYFAKFQKLLTTKTFVQEF